MNRGPSSFRKRKLTGLASVGVVALLHVGVFALIGLSQVTPRLIETPQAPIVVELFRPPLPPPPPPPPPPPQPPTAQPGGGAPAAPSIVRPSPRTVERPELVAPPVPAPEQPLVVGVAPIASPTPGQGQGGVGRGTGTGEGDGDGPGSGGTPPIIIRRATQAEILSVVPPAARAARRAGRSSVNCVIRIDQRLDDCRVVDETPPGFAFGEAALRAATFFRYRPPMTAAGRPVEGQRVTIFIQFGRQ